MFEPAIIELGEAIFGGDKICGFLKEDDITRGEIFKHTVAVMPSVKACHTFRNLLKKYKLIDKDREIIVAVENEDTPRMDTCAENVNDLNIKLQSLENEGKKSLTLTCNRLMTGASVPLWDSMLYMKDTDSAQEYDQAVFRICTRNVKTFRSGDKTEKVNLKPHVYLIDFKIDRMFKIIGDSARAISDVKKQRGLENLKTNVARDLSKLPLYVEWKSTGMGKVDPEDFMEYYTKYSKNNSIDDIIKNGINKFDVNKFNTDILNIISKFNKGSLHVNNKVDANKGEGENDAKFKTLDASNNLVLDDKGDLVSQNKAPKSKKEEEEKKNRLVSLLKNILYMVICFDGKIDSLIDLIDAIKNDEVKEETARIFLGDNPVGILNKLNTDLDTPALNEIDSEIMSINLLLNDESMTDAERMDVAIKKLGKLDKNEVVTPPSIAKRMIEKLDDSYYEKAERILEVNSKTGEFVREIYNKYGPEVAKKVKIVASSEMTKQFIRKILNLLGLPEYNLLNITADSDFVKVKGKMSENMLLNTEGYVSINEGEGENLREKELGNYDIVVMNPPYDGDLHLEFLNMGINVLKPGAGALVCVEPGQWLTQLKDNGRYTKKDSLCEKIKDNIEGHVKSVELGNMNREFNIANKTALSITAIDFNKEYNKIKLNRCGEISDVNSIYDCNLVGDYNIVKSILDKCRAYKDHMIDHCINIKRAKDYEGKGYYFLRYGNYMLNNLGSGDKIRPDNFTAISTWVKLRIGEMFTAYLTAAAENKQIYANIPISKSGNICDSVYGTKEELENWKYLIYNNKLPVFINICLIISDQNASREYLPWLVDKHYTDKEIYNLLGITKEEQQLIDETIKKFERNSSFAKNYFGA